MPRLHVFASRLGLVLFGLALSVVVLEGGMRAAGSLIRFEQARRNRETLRQEHEVRVLCLGESTTEGTVYYGHYPEMMQEFLNQQDLGARVAVINLGRSGADSRIIREQIARDLNTYKPQIIAVMMGINDAGRTHAYGTIIAPGADHWYGSFRVYKLYRMLRAAIENHFNATGDDVALVVGEGIVLPTPGPTHAPGDDWSGIPWPTVVAIEATLRDASALIDQKEFAAAEAKLTKLRADHPDVPRIHEEMARLFLLSGRPDEAHRVLEHAAATVTRPTAGLYSSLAASYLQRGNPEAAIASMRVIIDSIVPADNAADQSHYRNLLAELYEKQGQLDLAEATLRPIIGYDPGNDTRYGVLINFYDRHGETAKSAALRALQQRIRHEYINPQTRENYHIVLEEAASRGVTVFALQYPMRHVEALQRELDDDARVFFVDNGFFRDLVAKEEYWKYFSDTFGGDFGHLTRIGNRLLAKNVARAITERFFGLEFRDPDVAGSVPTPRGDADAAKR